MRLVHCRGRVGGLPLTEVRGRGPEARSQKAEVSDPLSADGSGQGGGSSGILLRRGDGGQTTRPTRETSAAAPRSAAFTLLEILLALALMALLAGALVTGSAQLIGDKPATAEDVFWQAVLKSRQAALKSEQEVRLSFDPKEKAFVLDDGTVKQSLPVPPAQDLTVEFLSAQTGGSTILIGGTLVDTQTMPSVTFYPDGTCTACRVQFRAGGSARILAIDPWTCAQVLARGDNPT